MPIKVGDSINYKGCAHICVAIEKRQAQQIASESSEEMRFALTSQQNCKHMGLDVAHFAAGEVINIFAEWCMLQRSAEEHQTEYIYTKYKVVREEDDSGRTGQEDANQAADRAAQTTNQQPAGG